MIAFFSDLRSILHKIDELELHLAPNSFVRDCCVMIITENWLHPGCVSSTSGTHYPLLRQDSGKSRGGGLCVYVHNDWCASSKITVTHCSPDIEAVTVDCRPFYLPRELTVVIITAVYIPPDANISIALTYLHDSVNKQQPAHPDGVHIIAGDFNQAFLKTVLPNCIQYVRCSTRGNNTLDRVYSNKACL